MSGVIVVVSPYAGEYGPPRTLEHVARAVVLAGYEPVCVVRSPAQVTDKLRASGVRVRVVPQLSTFPRTVNPIRMGLFFRQHLSAADVIRKLAREERALAVYSISEAILCGGVAARSLRIPSLVHVIGMSIATPRVTARLYLRLLDSVTSQFVACSSAAADMLSGLGISDEKIVVAHNAIPIALIQSTEGTSVPLIGEGQKIGMIAAYDPRKGHELFVNAAAEIARRFPTARFYIIGGTLPAHLESEAFERSIDALIRSHGLADRFERPGYVPLPEVYTWMRSFDVVVVPSRTEAFAHAVIEAMACGKPVVATAVEGNLDAFIHGESGLYTEERSSAVAAAVCELLADPGEAAAIGARARERAELYFDESVTLPAVADTIVHLIEREE